MIIAGNALHDPSQLDEAFADLLSLGRVFDLTLTPSESAVLERAGRDPGRDPERLAADNRLHASKWSPWSARIDNSTLTSAETLPDIAALVAAEESEILSLFHAN